jgi:hypothetical protein
MHPISRVANANPAAAWERRHDAAAGDPRAPALEGSSVETVVVVIVPSGSVDTAIVA